MIDKLRWLTYASIIVILFPFALVWFIMNLIVGGILELRKSK